MNVTYSAGNPGFHAQIGVQPPAYLVCAGCDGHVQRTTNGRCDTCDPGTVTR